MTVLTRLSWPARVAAFILVTGLLAGCGGFTSRGPQGLEGSFGSPVIGKDRVYVSGVDGYLYAFDRLTGEFEEGAGWRVRIGSGIPQPSLVSGPALDSEGQVVVVGSEDGSVYAFDAITGEERWKLPNPTGGEVWSTPLIRDQTVYFGSHDKHIYAVSLENGNQKWATPTGGVVVGRPLFFRNQVIVGSFDKKLYALEATSGRHLWTVTGDNWFWAGPVTDGSSIFAPSMDGNVYAIDRDGNLLWKHDMGSPIVSRPVLVPQGLMVAGKDGKVSLLDTDVSVAVGQREIAFTNIHGGAEVAAPLFAVGNSVFVGSQDSTVTRIEVRTNQAGQASVRTHWCLDARHGDVQCETAGE